MSDRTVWVFDTGPLRHFARNGWIGVLKFLAQKNDAEVVIPQSVRSELEEQRATIPELVMVLDADWIRVDRLDDLSESAAFARYEKRLVVGRQNLGECGVLALGSVHGYTVILDDSTPRGIGEEEGMTVEVTLTLLCQAIREKQLTLSMVEALADDLLAGKYFLPFEKGGFRMWALEEGALDWDDV